MGDCTPAVLAHTLEYARLRSSMLQYAPVRRSGATMYSSSARYHTYYMANIKLVHARTCPHIVVHTAAYSRILRHTRAYSHIHRAIRHHDLQLPIPATVLILIYFESLR